VRHSLAHGTIMAIEKGQSIPFDLSHFGVVLYEEIDRALFTKELQRHLEDLQRRPGPDSPVAEHLRLRVGTARMAANVADSPLDTAGALRSAKHDVLIIGQNLYALAMNDRERDRVFATLSRTTKLQVRILYADSRDKTQVGALSEIIDEQMPFQFPDIDKSFRAWCAEWKRRTSGDNRLQIRRCKRIGNISATLVDSDEPAGRILIRPILYHTGSNARPCFWVSKFSAPEGTFLAYKSALEQIWSHGEPVDRD
jgi:hypothetical protein